MKSSYTQNPGAAVDWPVERSIRAETRTSALELALIEILEAFDAVREGITYHHEYQPGAVRLHHAMDAARGLVGEDA